MIDVVIRMDRLFRADYPARELDRAVRDHFVGVHVRLGARPGLEDDERKFPVKLSINDLLRGAHDQGHLFVRQLSQFFVGEGSAFLEDAKCPYHRTAPSVPLYANWEIIAGPLRLGAPQMLARNFDIAEGVLFDTNSAVDSIADTCATVSDWVSFDLHPRRVRRFQFGLLRFLRPDSAFVCFRHFFTHFLC